MIRRLIALTSAAVALVAAAPAAAIVPETEVAGAASKWFSGSLIQQPGQNCSVLGSPYSEIMVSGIGSYGGTSGVVKVGDQYWTSFLLSVPGNPCGPGSSGIVTDVILPRNTAIDPTRPIRCFGQPRNSNTFVELTGTQWSAFGSSGSYCPAQASPSAYHAGAWNIGFRPIASGQLFELFVPVKTDTTLQGMGGPDKFSWLTDATGVYANPGLSEVWANVFSGGGSTPFVYFARTPAAVPFWKPEAPATPTDLRNRTEFWANFYVAQQGGNVTFKVRRTDFNEDVATQADVAGFNGAVAPGQDLVQINPTGDALGPNGGYAPFAWDAPDKPGTAHPGIGEWDTPMTITWTFTPSGGSPVSGTESFRTLAGPDTDGDGVADSKDACPSVKGTTADGCLPAAPADPDNDGIFGADDKCPNDPAPGIPGGCPPPGATPVAPGGTPPVTTPISARAVPVQLLPTLAVRKNARLRAAALRKGMRVRLTCSHDAAATLTLTVPRVAAKRLGLKAKGASATVATARGACTAQRGVTLTLKPAGRTASRIARLRKPLVARLSVRLTAPGQTPGGATVPVKLG